MPRKFLLAAAAAILTLAGCAGYRPVVDMEGVDAQKYENDLRLCQKYAEQRDPIMRSIVGALIGGAVGAASGAAIGGAFGNAGAGAAIGTAYAGSAGAGYGAGSGVQAQINIVRNCMSGRGYRVLD